MIISHKYKFIFVKCGKVAGTSIEIALRKCLGDKDISTPVVDYDEAYAKYKKIRKLQICKIASKLGGYSLGGYSLGGYSLGWF